MWTVLGKLGCSEKFLNMVKSFAWWHEGLVKPIKEDNGIKQGDILGLILFSLYFAIVLIEPILIVMAEFIFATEPHESFTN